MQLPVPSGHWVGCHEARELIWAAIGDRSPNVAERALARRAHVIPSRIVSWSYSWEPQEGIPRFELAKEKQDLSDWGSTPSRRALMRKWSVLECIGEDPANFIITDHGLRDACWITGDFEVVLDGDFRRETVKLIGLAFDAKAILPSLNLSVGRRYEPELADEDFQARSTAQERNPGGRPASRHGEVIAAATLRLSQLNSATLRKYTAEALATELEADYRKCGEAPPSDKSRALYASGILRVIRAREN